MIGDITYFDGVPHVIHAEGPVYTEVKKREFKHIAMWAHTRPATPEEVEAWLTRLRARAAARVQPEKPIA